MATFTFKQKLAISAAFSRGWKQAVADEATWQHLNDKGRADFFRSTIRQEFFKLPEKLTLWKRIKQWLKALK